MIEIMCTKFIAAVDAVKRMRKPEHVDTRFCYHDSLLIFYFISDSDVVARSVPSHYHICDDRYWSGGYSYLVPDTQPVPKCFDNGDNSSPLGNTRDEEGRSVMEDCMYKGYEIIVFADDDYDAFGYRYIGEYCVEVWKDGEVVYESDGYTRPDSAEYAGKDWVDEQ